MSEFVNPDTGEVEDIPEGMDRLFWAAHQLMDAQDQIKAWERRAVLLKHELLNGQEERKAVYGEVAVSVRQNIRRELDTDAFREWLADAMPNEVELAALAFAAKSFDAHTELMIGRLGEAIARNTREKPTQPFIVIERVRRVAPRGVA